MKFLEIAKRVRQECGISGDGPAGVVNQSGMSAKIVAWVKSAFEEIQAAQPWRFNWRVHTQALTVGVDCYDPVSDWGLSFRDWVQSPCFVYNAAMGPVSRHWLNELPWEQMREMVPSGALGVPLYCGRRPDGKIQLHPAPQAGTTLVVEYIQNPAALEQNTDIPLMPERYHMAIVWRAVMFWCAHDDNPALMASANANYQAIMGRMRLSELPQMQMPETLA